MNLKDDSIISITYQINRKEAAKVVLEANSPVKI